MFSCYASHQKPNVMQETKENNTYSNEIGIKNPNCLYFINPKSLFQNKFFIWKRKHFLLANLFTKHVFNPFIILKMFLIFKNQRITISNIFSMHPKIFHTNKNISFYHSKILSSNNHKVLYKLFGCENKLNTLRKQCFHLRKQHFNLRKTYDFYLINYLIIIQFRKYH